MIEDKLTREDRIRLEALALAAGGPLGHPGSMRPEASTVVERARVYEAYIAGTEAPDDVDIAAPGT